MPSRRLEVLLPADVSARDYAAVAHAIWAVLDTAGFGEDGSLRPDDGIAGDGLDERFDGEVLGGDVDREV
jgi:hypothetical protein